MAGGFRLSVVVLCFLTCGAAAGTARLYTEDDPLVLLGSGSLKRSVSSNSSSAWLVQFYSSWCGHCIQFSSTWKALAHDVQGGLCYCVPSKQAFFNPIEKLDVSSLNTHTFSLGANVMRVIS